MSPLYSLPQEPAQLLDSYDLQLLLPIGVGAYGVVYKGVYQGAAVAVKLVLGASLDKTSVREALVSTQLRHPHVVQTFLARGAVLTEEFVRAVGQSREQPLGLEGGGVDTTLGAEASEDGLGDPRIGCRHVTAGWADAIARTGGSPGKCLLVLVQEYCCRGTLACAIRNGAFKAKASEVPSSSAAGSGAAGQGGGAGSKPASASAERVARRMVLRTAAEICRGMVHLHAANVIHGDLKPANVLLAKSAADRRGFVAKIGDFGMTHLLDGDGSRCDSSTWGTLAYASPEAMNGQHTKTSDVYSFGVILSEMLTGKRPYNSLLHGQIMMGVSLELPDEEWPELCALARRCMEQDPDARPSFKELQDVMVEMEEKLRAESKKHTSSTRTRRGSSNHASAHTSALLLHRTSASASAHTSPTAAPTQQMPTTALPHPQRPRISSSLASDLSYSYVQSETNSATTPPTGTLQQARLVASSFFPGLANAGGSYAASSGFAAGLASGAQPAVILSPTSNDAADAYTVVAFPGNRTDQHQASSGARGGGGGARPQHQQAGAGGGPSGNGLIGAAAAAAALGSPGSASSAAGSPPPPPPRPPPWVVSTVGGVTAVYWPGLSTAAADVGHPGAP
ncbi:hypothetical protein HYH03_005233 [Edaphochlamys debaryana]|uniref:Protein kinase domain-containing protein n=1 Tax=Edaphochlamys debaryana TaxID=47281 RepID=A0A836C2L5_9CHLO|nr:hypothetical protein HYH03_005233 [Edaphochlamys debaryana]|eukprot:KAG2496828.1 hypothetical protein HYH03_005233 [Edaphochlamys debaryana]